MPELEAVHNPDYCRRCELAEAGEDLQCDYCHHLISEHDAEGWHVCRKLKADGECDCQAWRL